MTSLPESEPISGEIDLKETPAFRRTLDIVGEAINHWYGIKPEELPCLSPGSILFLSEEEFIEEAASEDRTENLLVRTLLNLGIKREEFFLPVSPGLSIHTHTLRSPQIIYVRAERFRGLSSQVATDRDIDSILLGNHLIELSLNLLPNLKPLVTENADSKSGSSEGESDTLNYWRTRLEKQVHSFFDANSKRVAVERQEELKSAREIFDYLLANDPSLRFLVRGGEILTMMDQGGESQLLIGVASRFNRKIALALSEAPKKRLMHRIAESNEQLDEDKILESLRRVMVNYQVSSIDGFLKSLQLTAYPDLFAAYQQSVIPQIYLERRRILEQAAARRGKLLKLEDYPLD